MRENDELYADSGEPVKESHGVSRGTALKVGGLGLAGALAAFMPGRAGAAVKKQASNASCSGVGFVCIIGNYPKFCGYDNYSLGPCYCGSLFYGKLRPRGGPVGACVENGYCYTSSPCRGSHGERLPCPTGQVCTDGGCCGQPVCQYFCAQGSIGQAPSLKTPKTTAHK